jgi:hypothetical protein
MSASPDTGAPVRSPTGHQTGQDTRGGENTYMIIESLNPKLVFFFKHILME